MAALTAILCVNWPLLADAVIFHVLLGVCDLIVKGSSPLNIYRPPMKLRQGNIFTSVCHVGGGWVSQVPCPFRGSGYVQDVGGCVRGGTPGHIGYGRQTGGTHPTGMISCSGRFLPCSEPCCRCISRSLNSPRLHTPAPNGPSSRLDLSKKPVIIKHQQIYGLFTRKEIQLVTDIQPIFI